MLVTRAVVPANRCGFCHLAVLKSFTSLAGLPFDLQHLFPVGRQGRISTRCIGQPNALFSTSLLRTSITPPDSHSVGVAENGAESSGEGADNNRYSSATSAAPIPWYLQIDTLQAPVYPVSDRQRLPDMPGDSPPMLEPLLKYVSIDLGLDDLSLFDLRKLDPPPALGSILLMILGTARSERHLHVSADRLCRWLRRTYRLTPFVDGLLGRNELKLKMRRKARRAKLLGTVGSSASNNADDGVRTGWVCVNVGTVESGNVLGDDTAAVTEIVGFGSRTTGVNIVIQMLTEVKRGELDLEELWGGMLEEQVKSTANITEHAQEIEDGIDVSLATRVRPGMTSDRARGTSSSPPRLNPMYQTQIRALHSQRTLSVDDGGNGKLDNLPKLDAASVGPMLQPATRNELPYRAAAPFSSETIDLNLARDLHGAFLNGPETMSLKGHLKYLKGLPKDAALKALGRDINDTSSTPFLRSLYIKLSGAKDVMQWKTWLELLRYSLELGHRGDPQSCLSRILGQIKATSAFVPFAHLFNMLKLMLRSNSIRAKGDFVPHSVSPAVLTLSSGRGTERRGSRYLPDDVVCLLRMAA